MAKMRAEVYDAVTSVSFQCESWEALRADALQQSTALADVMLCRLPLNLCEGLLEYPCFEAELRSYADEDSPIGDAPAVHVVGNLKSLQHIQSPRADLVRSQHGRDRRLGVEYHGRVAQQALPVTLTENLPADLS